MEGTVAMERCGKVGGTARDKVAGSLELMAVFGRMF